MKITAQYNSIEPFIPSGPNFEASKKLFVELGFEITSENSGYVGFKNNTCKFILQQYDNKRFAENLMVRITVPDLDAFWNELNKKELTKHFKIKLRAPKEFPYGREVHLIDLAGVCWHIAQEV